MRVTSDSISGLCLTGEHAFRRCGMTALIVFSIASFVGPAFGQLGPLIYSQAPDHLFALHSDTLFQDDFGQTIGELSADRFQLASGTSNGIGQLVWFGHYGTQNQGFDPDPPALESFRIRFYGQVNSPFPIQQLPSGVLYETSSDDVFRELTGGLVSPGRREYRYVLDLPSTFWAQSGTPYWLEISQAGDVASAWRWETARGGEYANQYPIGNPWALNSFGFQLAYQLRVPEPLTSSFMALVVLAGAIRRSSRSR